MWTRSFEGDKVRVTRSGVDLSNFFNLIFLKTAEEINLMDLMVGEVMSLVSRAVYLHQ